MQLALFSTEESTEQVNQFDIEEEREWLNIFNVRVSLATEELERLKRIKLEVEDPKSRYNQQAKKYGDLFYPEYRGGGVDRMIKEQQKKVDECKREAEEQRKLMESL